MKDWLKKIWSEHTAARYIAAILVFLFIACNAAFAFMAGAVLFGIADLCLLVPFAKWAETLNTW